MIAEALAWLATPAPAFARRLGYLAESIAIQARHRRCRAAWAGHVAASRAAILDAVARTSGRGTVAVLGSGAHLDLPLAELAAAFRRVLLVDLVHPWAARRAARRFPNVILVTDDVTGVLETVRAGTVATPRRFPLLADPEVDLTISLNLLSQLPVIPVRRLEGKVPDAELVAFAQALVRSHLGDLEQAPGATLLVADVERVVVDRQGRDVDRGSLLAEVAEPPADSGWWWEFAPAPEADPETSERRRVLARFLDGGRRGKNP
jgi:hypothetical protein